VRDARRKRLGEVARAGGDVEDDVAGPRIESCDQSLGDRGVDRRERLTLGLPSGCGGVPASPQLLRRLYALTPANCGRMSRPYASRVSS
jgi:hypothetical protein